MIDNLTRNERTDLLKVWPDGDFPEGLAEEIRHQTAIWKKIGRPGPLPAEALLVIVRQFLPPETEKPSAPKRPTTKKKKEPVAA